MTIADAEIRNILATSACSLPLRDAIGALMDRIEQLQERVDALEARG